MAPDSIALTIKKMRLGLLYSQQAFASRLGVSILTVHRYEHGRLPAGKSLVKLERLALQTGFKDYAALFHQALYNDRMPLDAKDRITQDTLENRYSYHAPDPLQVEQYRSLRAAALHFAQVIVEECPSSPERSTALTHLDIAVMMANAAIARNQPGVE